MEINVCDVNHSDADVLLPPRKRLLAGFKRQISVIEGTVAFPPPSATGSLSSRAPLSPQPSSPLFNSLEFPTRLNLLMNTHISKHHTLSPEKLVEQSKSAAEAAARTAKMARAAAYEKAAIAAKAVASARNALAVIASFPEEISAASKEKTPRKNKLKKHVHVQLLYKNSHDCEESSPTSQRNSSRCKEKTHFAGKSSGRSSDDSETSLREGSASDNLQTTKAAKARTIPRRERTIPPSKKKGKLKMKKLPLSMCNIRDKGHPEESKTCRESHVAAPLKSFFPLEPSRDSSTARIDASPAWKCQDLAALTNFLST